MIFPRGRKGSVRFHRLTPISGARPMAGGGEEIYKHMLTWNQKWGADSFEVATEMKSLVLTCLWIAHLSVLCGVSEASLMTLMSLRTPIIDYYKNM